MSHAEVVFFFQDLDDRRMVRRLLLILSDKGGSGAQLAKTVTQVGGASDLRWARRRTYVKYVTAPGRGAITYSTVL